MYKPKNGKIIIRASKEEIAEVTTASGIYTSADDTPKIKYDGTAEITHVSEVSEYKVGDKILFNAKKTDFLCVPDTDLMTMSERDVEIVYDIPTDKESLTVQNFDEKIDDAKEQSDNYHKQTLAMGSLLGKFIEWYDNTMEEAIANTALVKPEMLMTVETFCEKMLEIYTITKKEN